MTTEAPFARELDQLAHVLRSATDLATVLVQFERLVKLPGFFAAGRPGRSEKVDSALALLGRKLGDADPGVGHLTPPLSLPHNGFIHGAAAIGTRMAMYFYFEKLDLGLAAIIDGTTTDYFRFAAVVAPTRKQRN